MDKIKLQCIGGPCDGLWKDVSKDFKGVTFPTIPCGFPPHFLGLNFDWVTYRIAKSGDHLEYVGKNLPFLKIKEAVNA